MDEADRPRAVQCGQQQGQRGLAGRHLQSLLQRRATAFEDLQAQVVDLARRRGIARLQRQAQHGGRRLLARSAGAHHKQQAVVFAGGHLQAAQLVGPRLRQPGQHRVDARAAQRLLGGPQTLGSHCGLHPQQALAGHTARRQRRAKRHMGRCHQHHRRRAAAGQRRRQQPPFAVHAGGLQQLGQRPHRPAAAGQLGVQRRRTGSHHLGHRRGQCVGMPDIGVATARSQRQMRGRARHGKALEVILYL